MFTQLITYTDALVDTHISGNNIRSQDVQSCVGETEKQTQRAHTHTHTAGSRQECQVCQYECCLPHKSLHVGN